MANPLVELFSPTQSSGERWMWATVAQTNPLRVREDGAAQPIATTPKSLIPVVPGDRVLCLRMGRRLIVMGTMGGRPTSGPGEIIIEGRAYQASGVVSSPGWSVARSSGQMYVGTINARIPYQPPSGWGFTWSVAESSGFTWVGNGDWTINGNIQRLRVLQMFSGDAEALKSLLWQLTKA